jgi:hypothetical protein
MVSWMWCVTHGIARSVTLIVTPGFKAKPNAYSMCAQEESLHTYRTENGYRITNVTI